MSVKFAGNVTLELIISRTISILTCRTNLFLAQPVLRVLLQNNYWQHIIGEYFLKSHGQNKVLRFRIKIFFLQEPYWGKAIQVSFLIKFWFIIHNLISFLYVKDVRGAIRHMLISRIENDMR